MAKGGNNQRSNGSRFTKSYNTSNSFVTKVASRVSDYLGGWFGTPLTSSIDSESTDAAPPRASGDAVENVNVFDNLESRRSALVTHRIFDSAEPLSSPAKRFKISEKERVDIDFPISPIPSTSSLFQNSVSHGFDVPKSEDFEASAPGPSNPKGQKFAHANDVPRTSSAATDVKANGATDNHSDSSESTSGCSSLVPQSDRLSQSAYVCSARKRNLEEKLKYARQLQQSRASLYLNRSIPVSETSGAYKKPSFDVTAYGSPGVDKSLLRDKLINSPFYTGKTSYGGASAYRVSRNTFYSQRNPRNPTERKEGMQVQVRPSHHGSTEDLSNMSHTAKKILEALEQFSTPVSDAKRIPLSRSNVPLGTKRRRFDELSETRLRLSTPISPLNPNPGPVITGLNVPTVPDLLKLKRLERIQNSTAAARQVAVQKQEYSLPSEGSAEKRTGKIVTKLKNKEKDVPLEKLEEVNLPKIPLPITTLPKFDFQLPPAAQPKESNSEKTEEPKSKIFVFSPPIPVSAKELSAQPAVQKNSFTFSNPLNADEVRGAEKAIPEPLMNFMSSDAVAKLKRKSISDSSVKAVIPPVPAELKTGSVMDFLKKTANETTAGVKTASGTWECDSCLIRNINDSKICLGCKAKKVTEEKTRTLSSFPKTNSPVAEAKPPSTFGFGDKFKPPSGSWSCDVCLVNNGASAVKCVACESPKPAASAPKEVPKQQEHPESTRNGFGDMFKKQANQWECPVCMIRNKEALAKCAACETPKPGAKPAAEEPKFGLRTTAFGGFKFGVDKAGTEETGVKSAADSSTFQLQAKAPQPRSPAKVPQFNTISTSVGVFTFGIPPAQTKEEEAKVDPAKPGGETNGNFLVTSTSGSNPQKDEFQPKEKSEAEKAETKTISGAEPSKSEAVKPFVFGSTNKSPLKPLFGSSVEEKPKASEEPKKSNFFFGSSSNPTTLETVSSSTTDFTFGQQHNTPSTPQSGISDVGSSNTPGNFQFKPFVLPETVNQKPNPPTEEKKVESTGLSSGTPLAPAAPVAPIAPTLQPFAPSSMFDASSKITFGTTSTPSGGLGFGTSTNSGSSLFGASTLGFGTSCFNSQPSSTPSTTGSFGVMSHATEKPALSTGMAFGSSSVSLSATPNPFGSAGGSGQNPEPPKPFGSFGASSSIPGFGSNSTPAPAFGSSFIQPSDSPAKPPAPAPFIFGASAPASTSAPAPAVTAPGVFTFGASKPESKPSFSFGQSTAPTFSFGSSAPATNVFGGLGRVKPENVLGIGGSPFGSSTPSAFGQSSAPAAFESAAPKFDFGNSSGRQQEAPAVFQFGSAPAQPVSAPAGAGFSLSVPQKFNFTGGQSAVFSATPDAESATAMHGRTRKVIKAVRRTNREATRRPQ